MALGEPIGGLARYSRQNLRVSQIRGEKCIKVGRNSYRVKYKQNLYFLGKELKVRRENSAKHAKNFGIWGDHELGGEGDSQFS